MTQQVTENDNLLLIAGKSAAGKSASLEFLDNPEGVLYANCENGKKLPFKHKFKEAKITNPFKIYDLFNYGAQHAGDYHTIVIDTATYLMSLFEYQVVDKATDSRKAWGEYSKFWFNLMQQYVAHSPQNVVILAHNSDVYNENELVNETRVKVKGALMNVGIESFFTTVVTAKQKRLADLTEYESDLLNITDEDLAIGMKYVFQTKLTQDTINEKIRAPRGMWNIKETFIDNDVQHVLNRFKQFYG